MFFSDSELDHGLFACENTTVFASRIHGFLHPCITKDERLVPGKCSRSNAVNQRFLRLCCHAPLKVLMAIPIGPSAIALASHPPRISLTRFSTHDAALLIYRVPSPAHRKNIWLTASRFSRSAFPSQ